MKLELAVTLLIMTIAFGKISFGPCKTDFFPKTYTQYASAMGSTAYPHKYIAVDSSLIALVNLLKPYLKNAPLPDFTCGDLASSPPFNLLAAA